MIKKGDIAVVTTRAGLRMRRSPRGKQAYHKGRPLIRPFGWSARVTKARNLKGGERWCKFGNYWMAARFLKEKPKRRKGVRKNKVTSPVPGYSATTPWRKKPNNNSYWQTRGYHTGTDFAAPSGARVVAVRGGTVHRMWDSVLGNVCLLYADNGDTYWFCHLRSFWGRSGRKVKPGTMIGKVGDTGSGAMGPHLHLERRNGHGRSWSGRDLNPLGGW